MDKQLSRFTTHMQVYTYNDLFEQPIKKMLGPLHAVFPLKAFLSRMTLVQAYLHSSDSPGFTGCLERVGDTDQLRLTARPNPETRKVMKRFMKKLWSIRPLSGLIPLTPMLQPGEPGRGFHTGGSFPMSAQPVGFESDLLGRPAGMKRTHLIDASVLPSIAATTITYTVMANAHRIGTLADTQDLSSTEPSNSKPEETTMQETCAVTGAFGYVGSRIASALAADWTVLPLGRSVGPEGIRWTFDSPSIASELRARGVTALLHSAWDFRHPKAADNWQTNVEGSRRLIEAAQAAGVQRIVFISTISSFDAARSEYGKSKLAVEQLVLAAGGTVIRPGLVWGDRPGGMFGSLKEQVSKGKVVPMIGDGRYPQYLVQEDDLAEAVRQAMNPATAAAFAGRVLTIAHPDGWLLRDLILGIAKREGKSVKLVALPWRLVYTALKTAETLGLKLNFRSDSLISLIYHDKNPQFAADVPVRPFVMTDLS
jgi:nucleoside-diphosphate-sugar epimerase